MKKLLRIISILIILIIPIKVLGKKITCNSGDYSVTLELSKKKINIEDNTIINIESEYAYNVDYEVEIPSIVSVTNTGIVRGLSEGNTKIIAEISFLEDNTVVETCRVSLPIEVVSSDSLLKMLNLAEFDISEIFEPNTFLYTVLLPYNIEKINIVAVANNEKAKITGSGRRYLNEGNNIYEIIVTASDGSSSTYKIIIEREEASDDSSLKSLIVEGYILEPKFNKDIYKYNISILDNIESINIKAETTYEYATVKGIGTFNVASGENIYYINVLAENSTNSTYEIHVYKNNGSSKLKSLEIVDNKLDEEFDSNKYIYHTNVSNKIDKLEINAEGYDNDKIEIINNEELEVGINEIIIKVMGEDKTTTTYKIIANKLSNQEEERINKNNKLLKILLIMFIGAIIFMFTTISIFIKRNYKNKKKRKKLTSN